MVCRTLRRIAVPAVLAAVLVMPPAASAVPGPVSLFSAGEGRSLFAPVWDFLVSLFQGDQAETGCAIDPNGRQVCGPAPGDQAETGCIIDPNGRQVCGPAW